MRLLAEEGSITLAPLTGGAAMVTGDKNRLKQVIEEVAAGQTPQRRLEALRAA